MVTGVAPARGPEVTTIGRQFAEALARKDRAALRGLLAPDVSFKGLTPGRFWEAEDPDGVFEIVFGTWFDDQDRIAPFETATDGFTHVNLSAAWKPLRGNRNLTLMLQANNLFDAEGRRHASFTKDFVPLAGRNVKISARLSI